MTIRWIPMISHIGHTWTMRYRHIGMSVYHGPRHYPHANMCAFDFATIINIQRLLDTCCFAAVRFMVLVLGRSIGEILGNYSSRCFDLWRSNHKHTTLSHAYRYDILRTPSSLSNIQHCGMHILSCSPSSSLCIHSLVKYVADECTNKTGLQCGPTYCRVWLE